MHRAGSGGRVLPHPVRTNFCPSNRPNVSNPNQPVQFPTTTMKTYTNTRKLAALVSMMGTLALCGLSGGCASSQNHDSTGQYVDDTGITTRVKTALLRDDSVKSFEISVKTMKGVV